jgi:hypothetical protein
MTISERRTKNRQVIEKSRALESVKFWHVVVGWAVCCLLARFGPDIWQDVVKLWLTIVGAWTVSL